MEVLDLQQVTRTFKGPDGLVTAVDDVTMAVSSGEFVAVQGSSGCGKTTLLLAAGALQKPTEGKVHVDGENVYDMSAERRARFRSDHIGFVFQRFHLVPYLSVLDNVKVPALAKSNSEATDRAEELVERFNLTPRSRHVPAELSVGERQRAALARALFNDPMLVLADEPTGNLDDDNAHVVLSALREFADNGGAVLAVSHDPRTGEYSTRSLSMDRGRVTPS